MRQFGKEEEATIENIWQICFRFDCLENILSNINLSIAFSHEETLIVTRYFYNNMCWIGPSTVVLLWNYCVGFTTSLLDYLAFLYAILTWLGIYRRGVVVRISHHSEDFLKQKLEERKISNRQKFNVTSIINILLLTFFDN